MDDDLHKKLRTVQAKLILQEGKSVSISRIINDIIRKNVKEFL